MRSTCSRTIPTMIWTAFEEAAAATGGPAACSGSHPRPSVDARSQDSVAAHRSTRRRARHRAAAPAHSPLAPHNRFRPHAASRCAIALDAGIVRVGTRASHRASAFARQGPSRSPGHRASGVTAIPILRPRYLLSTKTRTVGSARPDPASLSRLFPLRGPLSPRPSTCGGVMRRDPSIADQRDRTTVAVVG